MPAPDIMDQPEATGPSLLDQAREEFPVLKDHDIGYKESFGSGQGYMESWPAGETGSKERPRPSELKSDKFGVEIYDPQTKPLDVLGDVVSHKLVNDDDRIKQDYENFQSSLTKDQKSRLKEQYQYAKDNNGEGRPYKDWAKNSGIPAYFRGYAFKQWENPDDLYTPQQMKKFDAMMDYLRDKEEKKRSRSQKWYDGQ